MKIKSAIFAVSMLVALSGSAANFVFHGNVSGNMLDVANWYEVSGTPDVWSIPMNNGADWTFSDASRLPTAGDTVGIARYYYGTDKSQILLPPLDKYIGESASIGKVVIGEGNSRNTTIWIGSDGHAGEDFTLTMDSYGGGSYQNATNNFYVNTDASQNSYSIKVLGDTYLTNDTHNWGSLITRALDRIEIKDLKLTFQKVFFNTYAKSYYISGSVNMNYGTDEKNDTELANMWTVYVPQNALTLDEPLIRIGGDLKREDQFDMLSEIVFDFNWGYEDYAPGEYTLISVGGDVVGFDDGGISIAGISDNKWSLEWKGNDLVLVGVPEPANVAVAFGALALAAAAYARRRK